MGEIIDFPGKGKGKEEPEDSGLEQESAGEAIGTDGPPLTFADVKGHEAFQAVAAALNGNLTEIASVGHLVTRASLARIVGVAYLTEEEFVAISIQLDNWIDEITNGSLPIMARAFYDGMQD